MSGARNGHICDLQTTANDLRKAEMTKFSTGNAIKSLLTETVLAGPSIKT